MRRRRASRRAAAAAPPPPPPPCSRCPVLCRAVSLPNTPSSPINVPGGGVGAAGAPRTALPAALCAAHALDGQARRRPGAGAGHCQRGAPPTRLVSRRCRCRCRCCRRGTVLPLARAQQMSGAAAAPAWGGGWADLQPPPTHPICHLLHAIATTWSMRWTASLRPTGRPATSTREQAGLGWRARARRQGAASSLAGLGRSCTATCNSAAIQPFNPARMTYPHHPQLRGGAARGGDGAG